MGWGRFFLYLTGGVSSLTFLYYFHKAKYSLHKTELLLLDRWRRLPLYPPPGPPPAARNSTLDGEGLDVDFVEAFAEWFVYTDLQDPNGVTRDDVLELLKELGFEEQEKPAKDFLYRGEGHIEERKRLSGAGLQESLSLVAKLALPDGKDSDTPSRLKPEAVEILKRKRRSAASVVDGASALRQMVQPLPTLQVPVPPADSGPAAEPSAETRADSAVDSEQKVDTGLEELQQHQLEVARLARIEETLMARLERQGSLSPAEESRLQETRARRAALSGSVGSL